MLMIDRGISSESMPRMGRDLSGISRMTLGITMGEGPESVRAYRIGAKGVCSFPLVGRSPVQEPSFRRLMLLADSVRRRDPKSGIYGMVSDGLSSKGVHGGEVGQDPAKRMGGSR